MKLWEFCIHILSRSVFFSLCTLFLVQNYTSNIFWMFWNQIRKDDQSSSEIIKKNNLINPLVLWLISFYDWFRFLTSPLARIPSSSSLSSFSSPSIPYLRVVEHGSGSLHSWSPNHWKPESSTHLYRNVTWESRPDTAVPCPDDVLQLEGSPWSRTRVHWFL